MKQLIVLLVLTLSLFGSQIEFSKISIDQGVKKEITTYWKARETSNYDLKKLYGMELAYLKFLHSKEEYRAFAPPLEFEQIKFDKIFQNKNAKLELGGWIITLDGDKHYFHDLWVKMDGKWYHRVKDKLLPF